MQTTTQRKRRCTHPLRQARRERAAERHRLAVASPYSPIEREHMRGHHGRCAEQWGVSAPCFGLVPS